MKQLMQRQEKELAVKDEAMQYLLKKVLNIHFVIFKFLYNELFKLVFALCVKIYFQEEELQKSLQDSNKSLLKYEDKELRNGSSNEQRIRELESQLDREKMMKQTVISISILLFIL